MNGTRNSNSSLEPPGTYVFDGPASRRGHSMNKLFMSLRSEAARRDFLGDEAACCRRFELSDPQTDAVLRRDWQAMLDLGGSIFYIYKLAMMDGLSMQYLGGVFTGMSEAEFKAAMLAGGRGDG
ncbi:protocatechuate 3,4-dioxygenase [Streptomyces fractus]|uniref:protocatechuate 3,4-dioxygenase n=1 Tax=Streptomyces fractus TaxID=641806 RepID=UPI003CF4F3A7